MRVDSPTFRSLVDQSTVYHGSISRNLERLEEKTTSLIADLDVEIARLEGHAVQRQ